MYNGNERDHQTVIGGLSIADELAIQNLITFTKFAGGSYLNTEEYETIMKAIKLHELATARKIISRLEPTKQVQDPFAGVPKIEVREDEPIVPGL